MKWIVLLSVVSAVSAILYYFARHRKVRQDVQIERDTCPEKSFYPEIEKCHRINTKAITCSCEDFRQEREQFRHDDPRRLCKHLVKSFIDAQTLPEDLAFFKEGIARCAEEHIGFPAQRMKHDKLLDDRRISIMIQKEAMEEDPWIDVYYEARRYRYSLEMEKWADETAPPHEKQILGFLFEKAGKPIPEAIRSSMRTPKRMPDEKKEAENRTAGGKAKEFCDVESILGTLLPFDRELALKETRNYLAVTFSGSRRWICRLYLNTRKSRYIEFPDGRRYEMEGIEDIGKYKEELMNAYRENSPKKGKERMLFQMNEKTPSRYSVSSMEGRDNMKYFSRN